MHIFFAFCYGSTIWLACLLYTDHAAPHRFDTVFYSGALVIAIAMAFLFLLDFALQQVRRRGS